MNEEPNGPKVPKTGVTVGAYWGSESDETQIPYHRGNCPVRTPTRGGAFCLGLRHADNPAHRGYSAGLYRRNDYAHLYDGG